jgi:hypothetical protein
MPSRNYLRHQAERPPHVACRRAEKDPKEKIGKHENKIPEPLPKAVIDMAANFDGNTAQNQAP